MNYHTLLQDMFGNSESTKLMICTVIFCLVFTAPAKRRVELRAKIGQYRNRCLEKNVIISYNYFSCISNALRLQCYLPICFPCYIMETYIASFEKHLGIFSEVPVLSSLTYIYRSYCPLLKFSFPDFFSSLLR